jgi:hypothetical protein
VNRAWRPERGVAENRGFVLGPALDAEIGTSPQALALILKGTCPATPSFDFPVLEMRDLAAVQVAAIAPAASLRQEKPGPCRAGREKCAQRLPTVPGRSRSRGVAAGMVRMLSLFDAFLRTLQADPVVSPSCDSGCPSTLTGVAFLPAAGAVRLASRAVIERGLA